MSPTFSGAFLYQIIYKIHILEIIAKTFAGMEDLLAEEIKNIGGKKITKIKRGVKFEGSEEVLYKGLLSLRTVLRLLVPVFSFMAHTEKDLYHKVKKQPWEDYLELDQTFAIDCVANSEVFRHSKFAGLRVKDALCDRFRAQNNDARPSVDTRNPDVLFNVHISNLDVTILLDVGGFSLHQRGYRTADHEAPLNEALAAGMIKLSGWDGKKDFIDPMCGSGTLLIEAGMIAQNIPPRINVNDFSIQDWDNFDPQLWNKVKNELKAQIEPTSTKIMGSDISDSYVELAQEAVREMGLDNISIKQCDIIDLKNASEGGVLISNPPYGERMDKENIIEFYKEIGDLLKSEFTGFEAWILSSNFEALKFIGLRPSRKIPLRNGALDCKMQKYELYSGSKKAKKQ